MIVRDVLAAPAVVVGGGIAGLSAALALEGCVVVASEPVGGGSSRLAQGGIAAAIAAGDTPALHAADTLRVSAGLADPAIAALVAESAAARIDWLSGIGIAFDRDADGSLMLGREAGHERLRIVHSGGDRTGAAVMQGLRAAVLRRPDIHRLEGYELVDLVTDGDRAAGVILAAPDGRRLPVIAPHVVLATGGPGACFGYTTNPATSRGSGLAAAARCGVRLADLEFMQFHPTALALDSDPLPLISEALRGAGAVLVDDSGERFMPAIHADAELAPRDIVARAVAARRAAGRDVLLDATGIARLEARFPGACAIARAAGLDATCHLLPVVAAAHFHMGGIATDAQGATSMRGLWACGEVACTGLHGGNRLASNSMLEGLVFGERVAGAIRASTLPLPSGGLEIPRRELPDRCDPSRLAELRHLVGASLGPLRSGPVMSRTLAQLASRRLESRMEEDVASVARLLLGAALARRESRGAHYRADYPLPASDTTFHRSLQPPAAPVAILQPAISRVA
jgi:L-aspartate oxidase